MSTFNQANVITPGGLLKISAGFASFEAAIGSKLYHGQPFPANAVPEPATAALAVARKRR